MFEIWDTIVYLEHGTIMLVTVKASTVAENDVVKQASWWRDPSVAIGELVLN